MFQANDFSLKHKGGNKDTKTFFENIENYSVPLPLALLHTKYDGVGGSKTEHVNRFNDNGSTHHIGNQPSGNVRSSYLAEFIFLDGQYEDYTSFGEFKNGVWIPKDPSGVTFGNNGFHLKFENASDLGNDSSGNNNDFTATGLGTDHKVLDSPTFGD